MVTMSSSGGAALSHHCTNATATGSSAAATQDKLPSIFIERPKMPRATWEALRNHIIRERQRKKQEQEQSQQVERMKKEREHKKKQEALTLEETKAEIVNAEAKLAQLKEEKHQLFSTLKKVLFEDDRRRSKESVPHQPNYMRPNPTSHYMKPPPHLLMAQGSNASSATLSQISAGHKRTRSPSPPRSTINSAYYRNPQGSTVAKYGNYANSAVASVSAAAMYPHSSSGVGGQQQYPFTRAHDDLSDRSKPIYLTQTGVSVAGASRPSSGGASSANLAAHIREQHQHRAAALAAAAGQQPPPVAHSAAAVAAAAAAASYRGGGSQAGASSGSILTGYPRTVSYNAPGTASQGSRVVQAPHQQPNGGVRYYGQREV